MPTETEDLRRRPRPEHEWHARIRERNNALREALSSWLADGNARRLRRAIRLVEQPTFGPPPSPRLRIETDRLVAMACRALVAPPAPKGLLQAKANHREAWIGRRV